MALQALKFVTLFLLLLLIKIDDAAYQNAAGTFVTSSSSSQWLKKAVKERQRGCRKKPWICSRGEFPPKSLCCRNRCVNVTSDINNCGLCGVRCEFNRECCGGLCINTNTNPFNCGTCGHRCPPGSFCFFGLCGYAEPSPPWRFPLPPTPPLPPKQKLPPQPPDRHPRPPPALDTGVKFNPG